VSDAACCGQLQEVEEDEDSDISDDEEGADLPEAGGPADSTDDRH